MTRIDVASVPEMKHVITEKQRELFGDKLKPYAIVCGSESSEQYFIQFCQRYFPEAEALAECIRCFRELEDAYDWLELSEADRAAAASVICDWEMARATDAWEVAGGYGQEFGEAPTLAGPAMLSSKPPPQARAPG